MTTEKQMEIGTGDFDHAGCCEFAGVGRGDCAYFLGLPGEKIPGQHDGPDDTVDVYGKPNGWCWQCWKSERIRRFEALREVLKSVADEYLSTRKLSESTQVMIANSLDETRP